MGSFSGAWQDVCESQPASQTALIVGTTVVTSLTLLAALRSVLYPAQRKHHASPLRTLLPRLPRSELEKLEYKPDAFPGARDVPTPYGSVRVYEWGPETGRKVLFIHGITTTCQTMTLLAHGLVAKGCRVMLFDLFGRGFSDNVGDADHDARLYVAQVLMVLASSPLSWTGTKGFSLVGYSMGGGIAVHVSAAFGHMIDSLVLLAPSGLIRLANFGIVSRLLFKSGLVPPRVLGALTRWRLQQPIASSVSKGKGDVDEVDAGITAQGLKLVEDEDPVAAAMTETVPTTPGEEMLPLEKRILAHTRWMSIHHVGFVPAFMSSIKDAPLVGQEESYRQLARREKGSTVLIFGRDDQIVNSQDYEEDALPLIGGKEHVIWRIVSGSHDFPMTHADEVLNILSEVWHLQ